MCILITRSVWLIRAAINKSLRSKYCVILLKWSDSGQNNSDDALKNLKTYKNEQYLLYGSESDDINQIIIF